ncbi:MAG: hypothetical protein JOZ08_02970 [Verrucomicrobia bacterium]|nr:hypothetical protein [Verrucomicrobiota bacterium]
MARSIGADCPRFGEAKASPKRPYGRATMDGTDGTHGTYVVIAQTVLAATRLRRDADTPTGSFRLDTYRKDGKSIIRDYDRLNRF